MNRVEVTELFTLISSAYPKDQTFAALSTATASMTKQATLMWYEMLKDIPFAALQAALARHASTSPFPPSIAELRTALVPEGISADAAWGMVRKAISQHGFYQGKEAKESLPPEVWNIVERMGWREMCFSENPDVIRGQFVKLYELQRKREQEHAALPSELAQRLGQIGVLPSSKLLIGGD